jgi:predicted nucleotidyltransferase
VTSEALGSPAERDDLVRRITSALRDAGPGCRVELRGSLAEHRADEYSDIDLLWTVPDQDLAALAAAAPEILSAVQPVLSVRSVPELQRSPKRRLLFVLFEAVPLFWRLDLDLRAASVATDPSYDLDNPAAAGTDWSLAASALANAIAAIKAIRRGSPDTARGLLERGFARISVRHDPVGADLTGILALADAASHQDPTLAPLATRVHALATALLSPQPPSY